MSVDRTQAVGVLSWGITRGAISSSTACQQFTMSGVQEYGAQADTVDDEFVASHSLGRSTPARGGDRVAFIIPRQSYSAIPSVHGADDPSLDYSYLSEGRMQSPSATTPAEAAQSGRAAQSTEAEAITLGMSLSAANSHNLSDEREISTSVSASTNTVFGSASLQSSSLEVVSPLPSRAPTAMIQAPASDHAGRPTLAYVVSRRELYVGTRLKLLHHHTPQHAQPGFTDDSEHVLCAGPFG
ncbi:hypothetical protein C8Q76DRAFT_210981 [Earliella scabrosa]|nr:hypothetical protein C8Q76DRAFT_210981 [Earliella scabrosa]